MSISKLPPEVVEQIIREAVKVRGLKRAGRLRYVSKSWNAMVLDAICLCGVMPVDAYKVENCSYLSYYAAKRIMSSSQTLPRPLQVIRQVAARIVSHRNKGSDDSNNYNALRDCVFDLCRSCDANAVHLDSNLNGWVIRDPRPEYGRCEWFDDGESIALPIDEHDEQFRQALLAAAVWTNDVALVREILLSFRDYLYTPYFISMAAYRGHNEILSLLFDAVGKSSTHLDSLVRLALKYSVLGDQVSTVDRVLEPMQKGLQEPYEDLLLDAEFITGVEVFRRFMVFIREQLCIDQLLEKKIREEDMDSDNIRHLFRIICCAASNGNMAFLRYFFEEKGIKEPRTWTSKYGYPSPLEDAASEGRVDALVYLLGKGLTPPRTLPDRAAQSRNPDIMRIVLENDAAGRRIRRSDFRKALISATLRENEPVVRLLLSCGNTKIINVSLQRFSPLVIAEAYTTINTPLFSLRES
ncbi:hypothetical protein F4777DRAFT_596760 [Nemania sp. FL0916]|nr:hypothetical protein F4777DRAFT_596760 [Nemania sp. FL0916]